MQIIKIVTIFFLLCQYQLSLAHSNLIFLGDSLSDTGNYPQSDHLFENRFNDNAQYAFIPPTNPVNTSLSKDLVIQGKHFAYPISENPSYLLAIPPLDDQQRQYRSVNWTEYLIQNLFTKSQTVVPHMMQAYGIPVYGSDISVNYSWWSAVTSKGCYNDVYLLNKEKCNVSDLYHHRDNKVEDILIPGVLTQVSLIQQDVRDHNIYTDDNTLFVLNAGGNSLYLAEALKNKGGLKNIIKALDMMNGGGALDIVEAMHQLSLSPVNAKHFLIINLYDLRHTPRFAKNTKWKLITSAFTHLFNYRLKTSVRAFSKHNTSLDVRLFDNYAFFEDLTESNYFKESLGHQCDEDDSQSPYYTFEASTKNCTIDDNHGYLFWNNSHPSGLVHALFAKSLSDFIQK